MQPNEFGFILDRGTTHRADRHHGSRLPRLLYTPRPRAGRPCANRPAPAGRRGGAAPCRILLRPRRTLPRVPRTGRTGPSPGFPGPCSGSSTSSHRRGEGRRRGGHRRTVPRLRRSRRISAGVRRRPRRLTRPRRAPAARATRACSRSLPVPCPTSCGFLLVGKSLSLPAALLSPSTHSTHVASWLKAKSCAYYATAWLFC